MKTLMIALALLASPAAAQYSEIGGANLDAAGSIAGQTALGSYAYNKRKLTPAQRAVVIRTCRYQLPQFRVQYGRANPQVRKLTRMCAAQGY